jgi:hypothetical protein
MQIINNKLLIRNHMYIYMLEKSTIKEYSVKLNNMSLKVAFYN